jgi:hypothetical protein
MGNCCNVIINNCKILNINFLRQYFIFTISYFYGLSFFTVASKAS